MMPFWNLGYMFFRLGLFSFGGGYAMLPLIYQGIQQFGMMGTSEFSRLVALSQVTPGPIAVNAATYVGFQYAGAGGAAVATIAVTLPSLILVLAVMHFFTKFQSSESVQAVLAGIRPATVALLASAVIFLAEGSIFKEGVFSLKYFTAPLNYMNYMNWMSMAFFAVVAVLHGKFRISPIKLTLIAGVMGALFIHV